MKTTQEAIEWLKWQDWYEKLIIEVAKANPDIVENYLRGKRALGLVVAHFGWSYSQEGYDTWNTRDEEFTKFVRQTGEIDRENCISVAQVEAITKYEFCGDTLKGYCIAIGYEPEASPHGDPMYPAEAWKAVHNLDIATL